MTAKPSRTAALIVVISAANVLANTDFRAPPRFDGAGYAVLARSLMQGRGYREISHPDAPRHDHFPPGYPLALAACWLVAGVSFASAHALSMACTIGAALLAWVWLRRGFGEAVGGWLGLAIAANAGWGRIGGAIQSEPLYLLLGQAALLLAAGGGKSGPPRRVAGLGVLLLAASLTRQVGLALTLAVVIHLVLMRAWRAVFVICGIVVVGWLPWIWWQGTVASRPQATLIGGGGGNLSGLIGDQALFYLRRLPDSVLGPLVEVATVFSNRPELGVVATVAALGFGAVLGLGWFRLLGAATTRLIPLVALVTLGVLLVWPFTEAGRFLIPLVPCVLAGLWSGLRRLGGPTLATWLVVGLSIPYPLYAALAGRAAAERALHTDDDAAGAWIREEGGRPGPVLARHAAEVYWTTGRRAVEPPSEDPAAIALAVKTYRVAYLLVSDDRYARAGVSALRGFVAANRRSLARVGPAGAAEVWEVTDVPD